MVVHRRKKREKNRKCPGPPVHNNLVERGFIADEVNEPWLTDIMEHWTSEGRLYLYAIKDVFSGRIVGHSMNSRMKARLVMNALANVPSRENVAGCIVHSNHRSQLKAHS